MRPRRPNAPDTGGADGADRFGIYAEFDRASSPELFAALGAIVPGKQRAQRLRMLALKGWMFEQMQPLLHGSRSAAATKTPVERHGADDVFGAPIDS